MKNRYTVYGTREFDQKIDDDMHIIAEAVAGGISGNQIAAVILGGGYGRGEGGVHRNSKGEMSLHNDYDMFVITDNVSYSARQKINRELRLEYILPTMFDRRTRHSYAMFDQLKKHFARQMCDPIHYSVRLAEAPTHGRTIFEYRSRTRGAHDYENLVRRIMKNGSQAQEYP